MSAYHVHDVAAALRMSHRTIYALVRSGFVKPVRGPRRQLQFSFQDILLLKTANGLVAAAIPRRRITRAVAALRRQLPSELPLAGLRIRALGDRVVAQSITHTWDAESGQGMFAFDVTTREGRIQVIDAAKPVTSPPDVDGWFAEALALEDSDAIAARQRYALIIEADNENLEAYINCGRLLHLAGDCKAAEVLYRKGIAACEGNATLFFNLGVLLEDQKRSDEAIVAYQQALQCNPDHTDSHYNLSRLFEASGRAQHAIRHFNSYRRLTK
jgi:tetratricopeptide (TPR) repeat protein